MSVDESIETLIGLIYESAPTLSPALFPSSYGIHSLRDICVYPTHESVMKDWLTSKNSDIVNVGFVTKVNILNRTINIVEIKVI